MYDVEEGLSCRLLTLHANVAKYIDPEKAADYVCKIS